MTLARRAVQQMGNLRKYGTLLWFVFLLPLTNLWAAPEPQLSEDGGAFCASLLRPDPALPAASEIEAYLREHMLFGPEVTFTSTVLGTISNERLIRSDIAAELLETIYEKPEFDRLIDRLPNFDASLTAAHGAEIVRLLRSLPGLKKIKLHVLVNDSTLDSIPLNGVMIHRQALTLELEFEGQYRSHAIMTIEPACVEINFTPQKIDEFESVWSGVFEAAHRQGFVGAMGFAAGGGGGHMHVGFDSADFNLFVRKPKLLADFMMFMEWSPGLRYFLGEFTDHGRGKNSPTAHDLRRYRTFERLVEKLYALDVHKPDYIDYVAFLQSLPDEYKAFFQHYFFMSMKNAHNKNARLEARFVRSYESISDLKAVSELMLKTLAQLYVHGLPSDITARSWSVTTELATTLRTQFEQWMQTIGLDAQTTHRLLHFGGQDMMESRTIRAERGMLPRGKSAVLIPLVPSPFRPFRHEVILPISAMTYERLHHLVNKQTGEWIQVYLRNDYEPGTTTLHFEYSDLWPFSVSTALFALVDEFGSELENYELIWKPADEPTNSRNMFQVQLRRPNVRLVSTYAGDAFAPLRILVAKRPSHIDYAIHGQLDHVYINGYEVTNYQLYEGTDSYSIEVPQMHLEPGKIALAYIVDKKGEKAVGIALSGGVYDQQALYNQALRIAPLDLIAMLDRGIRVGASGAIVMQVLRDSVFATIDVSEQSFNLDEIEAALAMYASP